MEEEDCFEPNSALQEPIPVYPKWTLEDPTKDVDCMCLREGLIPEKEEMSARKQQILTTVGRTEAYLRERRIPELIRYLLTKVITQDSEKPVAYLEKLLNDCMIFRAGHGAAPVLYERKHLEAVVKSFDPGQRGWMSAGQVHRAYNTLGLVLNENIEDRVPTEAVLQNLELAQETELLHLLSAGMHLKESSEESL